MRDGFLRSLRRRNRRPNTIKSYSHELGAFGAWLSDQGVTSLPELGSRHIEAWQDDMLERQITPRSQMVRISALRGCLKWATLQDLPVSSQTLWLRIESPRLPPLDPRPISRRDLKVILPALERADRNDVWALRTRALFWGLFSSGARISEMLSMHRGALDPDGSHIIQKGGRPHVLLLSRHAIEAIEDYDRLRQDECPMMFVSLFPGHLGHPMKEYEAQKCWDRLCRELGLLRFKSHQIRHTCATTLRQLGVDVVLGSRHLGHRGLATMQGYALVDVDDRQYAVSLLDSLLDAPGPPRAMTMIEGAIAS